MIAARGEIARAQANGAVMDCVQRHRTGDPQAAGDLIDHLRPGLQRIVRRHLPRRDSIEDLVQEVLVKVFARLNQYNGGAPFHHWAHRIALYTCFDHLRAQRRRGEFRSADLSAPEERWFATGPVDENTPPPGDDMGKRELCALLLAQLGERDRELVSEFYFSQRSVADIAATASANTEFVKMRLFRARKKLRRALKQLPRWDRS